MRIHSKHIIINLFLLLFISNADMVAQDSITTYNILDNFFTSKTKNEINQHTPEDLNFKSKLSLLESINLRTETSENDISQQEYNVRLKFYSKSEKQAYKNNIYRQFKLIQLDKDQLNYEITEQLYIDIIEHIFLDKAIINLEKTQAIYQEQLDYLRSHSNDLNIIKIVSVLKKKHDITYNISSNYKHKSSYSKKLLFDSNQDKTISIVDFISIDDVMNIVKNINLNNLVSYNSIKLDIERDILLSERQNLSFQNHEWLDYLQLGYKNKDDLYIEKSFNLGASINIPLQNSNQQKETEIILEQIHNQTKTSINKTKHKQSVNEIKTKIFELYDQLVFHQNATIIKDLESTFEFAKKNIDQIDPLDISNLKIDIINYKKDQNVIEKEIYLKYIQLLNVTGLMNTSPIYNHLTTNEFNKYN